MIKIFKIKGDSLSPFINDGDLVLSFNIFPYLFNFKNRTIRKGDLIVFEKPNYPKMIKRVLEVHSNGAEVYGYHTWSVDSRSLGIIKFNEILFKIDLLIKKGQWRPYRVKNLFHESL